jgi:hypothetical protein
MRRALVATVLVLLGAASAAAEEGSYQALLERLTRRLEMTTRQRATDDAALAREVSWLGATKVAAAVPRLLQMLSLASRANQAWIAPPQDGLPRLTDGDLTAVTGLGGPQGQSMVDVTSPDGISRRFYFDGSGNVSVLATGVAVSRDGRTERLQVHELDPDGTVTVSHEDARRAVRRVFDAPAWRRTIVRYSPARPWGTGVVYERGQRAAEVYGRPRPPKAAGPVRRP